MSRPSSIIAFLHTQRKFSRSQSEWGPFTLRNIYPSSPQTCRLTFGMCSDEFSVPEIYAETDLYDDVYVSVLMMSYFVLLTISLGNHILGIQGPINSCPQNFTKYYSFSELQRCFGFLSERSFHRNNKKLGFFLMR